VPSLLLHKPRRLLCGAKLSLLQKEIFFSVKVTPAGKIVANNAIKLVTLIESSHKSVEQLVAEATKIVLTTVDICGKELFVGIKSEAIAT
jgi:hypothetical protein